MSRGWRRWLGSLQAAAVATGDLLELHTLRTFCRVAQNFFHSSVYQRWQLRCFVAPRLTVVGHFITNSSVTVLRFYPLLIFVFNWCCFVLSPYGRGKLNVPSPYDACIYVLICSVLNRINFLFYFVCNWMYTVIYVFQLIVRILCFVFQVVR